MEQPSKELARVTAVETTAERTGHTGDDEISVLAPAAAAALNLLADAILRGRADYSVVVQALKDARVDDAFARTFDASAERVFQDAEDPYDFDVRMHADNLSGAASDVRRVFDWL